ncbi:fimbrial protein [Klebsiella aerogenes]
MKKIIACSLLFSAAALSTAQAADGTITFEGSVNAVTCTIDSASKDMSVLLPSINSSAFSAANTVATSPAVKFKISATGCDAAAVSAAAVFSTGDNVDPENGNLNNTYPDGTDVQVRLFKADGTTAINLANYGESADNKGTVTDGKVDIEFYANYFSKASTATPGLLKTSIQYSVQYL